MSKDNLTSPPSQAAGSDRSTTRPVSTFDSRPGTMRQATAENKPGTAKSSTLRKAPLEVQESFKLSAKDERSLILQSKLSGGSNGPRDKHSSKKSKKKESEPTPWRRRSESRLRPLHVSITD